MKVLHVTASASIGGGGEHIWLLLRLLEQHGVRSFVAAPRDYPYWERFAQCVGEDHMLEIPHRRLQPPALLRLASFAREKGIDLLHSHGKGAGLYTRMTKLLTGIPCVHTFHGIHRGTLPGWVWEFYCTLERLLARLTRAAIAVSEGERRQILDLRFCRSDALHLVPNGVFCPPDISPAPPEARRDIVHTTRFDPAQKNSGALVPMALALRQAGRLERFRFVVLGDGPLRATIESSVQNLGLANSFVFHGAVNSTQSFLKEAFCCLSTSRWEGLPLALLEAMAAGVPVVASDVVGNNDAVTHGRTGLLFPVDDLPFAAKLLLRLADEPELWTALGAAARNDALSRFNAEGMARGTAEVYHAVLG